MPEDFSDPYAGTPIAPVTSSGINVDPVDLVRKRLGDSTFQKVDEVFRQAGISTFAWAHNAYNESGGSPARSGMGGAVGLFQLDPSGVLGDLTKKYGRAGALEIARDPVASAGVMAEIARAKGVHTLNDPYEQAKAFTTKVERPAARFAAARVADIGRTQARSATYNELTDPYAGTPLPAEPSGAATDAEMQAVRPGYGGKAAQKPAQLSPAEAKMRDEQRIQARPHVQPGARPGEIHVPTPAEQASSQAQSRFQGYVGGPVVGAAKFAIGLFPNIAHALDHPNPNDSTELETAFVKDFGVLRAAGLVGKAAEQGIALTKAGQAWLRAQNIAGPVKSYLMKRFSPAGLAGASAGGAAFQAGANVTTGRPLGEGVPQAAVIGPVFHTAMGFGRDVVQGANALEAAARSPEAQLAREIGRLPVQPEPGPPVPVTQRGLPRRGAVPTGPTPVQRPPVPYSGPLAAQEFSTRRGAPELPATKPMPEAQAFERRAAQAQPAAPAPEPAAGPKPGDTVRVNGRPDLGFLRVSGVQAGKVYLEKPGVAARITTSAESVTVQTPPEGRSFVPPARQPGRVQINAEVPNETPEPAAAPSVDAAASAPAAPVAPAGGAGRGAGVQPVLPGRSASVGPADSGGVRGQFAITGQGGVKLPGKRPMTFDQTADMAAVYDAHVAAQSGAEPQARENLEIAIGKQRMKAAIDRARKLKEMGIRPVEVIDAHKSWVEERNAAHQAADYRAGMREHAKQQEETSSGGRALVRRAASLGGKVEFKDNAGKVWRYHYVGDAAPHELAAIYDEIRTENRDNTVYRTAGGEAHLESLVKDFGLVPADVWRNTEPLSVPMGSSGAAQKKPRVEYRELPAEPVAPVRGPVTQPRLIAGGVGPNAAPSPIQRFKSAILGLRGTKTPSPQGKGNYAEGAAIRSKTTHGLAQTEKADWNVAKHIRHYANAEQIAGNMHRQLVDAVEKHLGKGKTQYFNTVQVENALHGTRDRYQSYQADLAAGGSVDPDVHSTRVDAVQRVQPSIFGRKSPNYPNGALAAYDELVEKKAPDAAKRAFLTRFYKMAEQAVTPTAEFYGPAGQRRFNDYVAKALTPGTPEYKAQQFYKANVEKHLHEAHLLNQGEDLTHKGPLDSYFPLTPADAQGNPLPPTPGAQNQRFPWAPGRNPRNKFRTGLSDQYDTTGTTLGKELRRAMRANLNANMWNEVQKGGLAERLTPDAKGRMNVPPTFNYRGVEYQRRTMPISGGVTFLEDGKRVFAKPGDLWVMPKWFHEEMTPIVEHDRGLETYLSKGLAAETGAALASPYEMVWHGTSQVGTVLQNTPFIGESLASKTVGSVPGIKKVNAIARLATSYTDPTTPENMAIVEKMGRLGQIPTRYGSETYSKQYAQATGIKHHPLSLGPALYGPRGLDMRVRILLYKTARLVNEHASDQEISEFVGQAGNYVHALKGGIQRHWLLSGVSPFFEAGKQQTINSVRALTGTSPLPTKDMPFLKKAGYRTAQIASGGAGGAVAIWLATYRLYRGKNPWDNGEPPVRLGQIPVKDVDRYSRFGKAQWGTGKDPAYIDVWAAIGAPKRGARALGIEGAFNTKALGGTAKQVVTAGGLGMMNAALHPVAGPPVNFASVGLTGRSPYWVGGREGGGFIPAVEHPEVSPANLEQWKEALIRLNPLTAHAIEHQTMAQEMKKVNPFVKAATDIAAPSVFPPTKDLHKMRQDLHAEAIRDRMRAMKAKAAHR